MSFAAKYLDMTETPSRRFPEALKFLTEPVAAEGVSCMVLRLRISEALWARLSRLQKDFDQVVQQFLDGSTCWMFEKPELRIDKSAGVATGSISHVIVAEDFEFRLEKPNGIMGVDYDLVGLRPKTGGFGSGTEVKERILVCKPDGVFSGDVAVVIKTGNYKHLAAYLKAAINLAWRRLHKGREVRRVFLDGDVLFYLTPNQDASMANDTYEDLNEALVSVDAGRVIRDPYELWRIREMAVKFGETLHT
jgi:hypothetical protein